MENSCPTGATPEKLALAINKCIAALFLLDVKSA
jgi:hypothetical protein